VAGGSAATWAMFGLALAFVSALSSVVSHAFLKAGEDRLAIRVWCCAIEFAAALPVALWIGPLPRPFWWLAIVFALVGAFYQLVLIRSYRLSDFSAAYPIARGVVPLGMAIFGALLLGDQLSLLAYAAILAITLGIVLMALGKVMTWHGWAAALLTGASTIVYNLLAAKGMREAADPLNFLAWVLVADSLIIPVVLLATDRTNKRARLAASFHASWPIGLLMLASYSALAFAMRYAPVGSTSAIRESSVLIGLVLAVVMLKERLDARRIASGVLIAVGAVTLVFV
jgi:drug/metabolite transporter (DMT)-like permease